MTKGRKILIAVLGVLTMALGVLYFTVVRPLITEVVQKEPVETEPGEEVGTSDRIFMFSQIKRENISSIEVSNSYGGYTFLRGDDNNFHIKGYEELAYSEDLFASLVDTCANTLSKAKVMSSASDERLKEYGLDQPSASWTLTDNAGKKYTVYVGKPLLTGGGYYCMYAGRRSVYVLDTAIEDTVLSPVENMITPYIIAGVSKDDYFTIDNFRVYKNMELMMEIGLVDKEDQKSAESLAEHIVTYPAQYTPESEIFYTVIMSFMSLQGESVADVSQSGEANAWSMYGLDRPETAISFKYGGKTYEIYFSSLSEDGAYYYASSNMFPELVVKCPADDFKYVGYGLFDWISPYFFQTYITSVESMTVKGGENDVTFRLTHGRDDKDNATLTVKTGDGTLLESSDDVQNFRQYYKALLSFQVIDYLPFSENEADALITDESKRSLSIEIKLLNGDILKYEFYPYSTRRSAVSINGSAEFYVYSDLVEKIISDTARVIAREKIDAYGKS